MRKMLYLLILIVLLLVIDFVIWYNMKYNVLYKAGNMFNASLLLKQMNVIEDERGLERMKQCSVVITGLCRDIGAMLPVMIERLREVGRMFKCYKIVLYENDSSDDTVDIIRSNSDIILIKENLNIDLAVKTGNQSLSRFEKMAYFRNKCVERIELEPADYVIVVDMDLTGGIKGLSSCFSYDNWDVMFPFGIDYSCFTYSLFSIFIPVIRRNGYYDPLAFEDNEGGRIKGHSPVLKGELEKVPVSSKDKRLLRVNSAFAGLGVYKYDAFVSGRYSGYDCEHICFHRSLRENGYNNLFINPRMIILR